MLTLLTNSTFTLSNTTFISKQILFRFTLLTCFDLFSHRQAILFKYKNICGCIKRENVLLAMSFIPSSWALTVFNFHKSEKHHENTVAHILSLKHIELFGKSMKIEYSLNDIYQLSIGSHSEQVKKNICTVLHF